MNEPQTLDVTETHEPHVNMDAPKPKRVKKGASSEVKEGFKALTENYKNAKAILVDKVKIERQLTLIKKAAEKANDIPFTLKILTWERSRGIIGVKDNYFLNENEESTLTKECEVINPTPAAFQCSVATRHKFRTYFDESRQCDIYVTYIKFIKEPEEQISRELASKIQRGFAPDKEDYAPEKELCRRFSLVESEWIRYFKELV